MIKNLLILTMFTSITCFGAQNGTGAGMKKSQSEPALTKVERNEHALSLSSTDSFLIPVNFRKLKRDSSQTRSRNSQVYESFLSSRSLPAELPDISSEVILVAKEENDINATFERELYDNQILLIPEKQKMRRMSPAKPQLRDSDDLFIDEDASNPQTKMSRVRNRNLSYLHAKMIALGGSGMIFGLLIYTLGSSKKRESKK